MKWQPIETAPKDDERVLLYSGYGGAQAVCRWSDHFGQWMVCAGGTVFQDPNHWMPLPPAPEDQQ